jgi:DNA modification methylase
MTPISPTPGVSLSRDKHATKPDRMAVDKTGPARPADPGTLWRNRITGHGEVDPATLTPNPANWRSHPEPQQRALASALGEVGWVAQVLVNRTTGNLIDGHLRVELARREGEPTIPVTYVELSEAEEDLVLASLDPLAAMATVERDALAALLERIETDDADLRGLLADLADENGIRTLIGDPDDLPDLVDSADVTIRPGDLWVLGDHRLMCGDATDPAAVARLLDDSEPTLLVTDPPYGVELDQSWRDEALSGQTKATGSSRSRTAGHRNLTMPGDDRIDWSEAFELVPSLSVGYIWHGAIHAAPVARGLERIGFEIVSQVIWDKGAFALGRSWYHWGHEPCWVVRKRERGRLFQGSRDQGTIWRAPSPKMVAAGSDESRLDHPAQKPIVLAEIPIRNHLRAGETVYDPFLGSGTTLVAAEGLGRRCLGLEIDPRYCQLVIDRWQQVTGRAAERIDD